MVNGKTITASTEFVPITPDGTVDIFQFLMLGKFGGRKLVVYECARLDGNTVASHTDISDTDQTIYVPKLRTTIFDYENGSHNSAADEDITLIDTVRYNGVEIGRRYTVVKIALVDKNRQCAGDDAGNKITASNEFVAEKINGTIDVIFKFSGVCLAGKTTVARRICIPRERRWQSMQISEMKDRPSTSRQYIQQQQATIQRIMLSVLMRRLQSPIR